MSRATLMIIWVSTVAVHTSIILFVPPLLMQLIVLGVVEGILGVAALRVRAAIEQGTIRDVIDLADAEERATASLASGRRRA